MSKGKREQPLDPLLMAAAEEELTHAAALSWGDLARILPWGDAFEGFAPDGSEATFERANVWAEAVGGDILCEVTAYRGEPGFEAGVTASCLIRRPG